MPRQSRGTCPASKREIPSATGVAAPGDVRRQNPATTFFVSRPCPRPGPGPFAPSPRSQRSPRTTMRIMVTMAAISRPPPNGFGLTADPMATSTARVPPARIRKSHGGARFDLCRISGLANAVSNAASSQFRPAGHSEQAMRDCHWVIRLASQKSRNNRNSCISQAAPGKFAEERAKRTHVARGLSSRKNANPQLSPRRQGFEPEAKINPRPPEGDSRIGPFCCPVYLPERFFSRGRLSFMQRFIVCI